MKRFFLTMMIMGACAYSFAQEVQEDLSVLGAWRYNGDMSNALYQHISAQAFKLLNERWTTVAGLKTKSDWEKRQTEVKRIFKEVAGEFPPKTPLNPKVTGILKKDGFTVEKVYFESRPGYYVTALLFVPTGKKGKLPAILYCCGHTVDGFKGYQKAALQLVKKGFVVLAFDPVGQGERIQYFDSEGKPRLHPDHEHSYPGTQSFISGLTPANYFIWDGIRAIDYLISRKEVDPTRIGITGRSGGGTQTAMIASIDDRIVAAAPECYVTSYDKLFRTEAPQDVEQNLTYLIKKGLDMSDFLEVRAPKPTLMVTTTMDYFSIQGARDSYNEAKKMFAAYGYPDNLSMVEDDAGHENTPKNMMALHAFFQKHLNNPGDPKVEELTLLTEKEMTVTPDGKTLTSLHSETLFSLNVKYADEVIKKQQTEKQNNADFYAQLPQTLKALSGYAEPVLHRSAIFSGRFWRDGYAIEKYLVKGAGDYYVPVLRLMPEKNNGKCVLLLDDQGKSSAVAKGGLAEKIAQKGYQVVVPDLIGIGELSGGFTYGDAIIQDVPLNIWYAGILTHKSPLAIRVEEIKILVDFIKGFGISNAPTGVAYGTLTADLLHAAVINREFGQIALIQPLYSNQSIVKEREYRTKFVMSALPGGIAKYDVPDLVTALAPLKLCLINPVNALDQMIDSNLLDQTYKEAKQKYDASPNFSVSCKDNNFFSTLEKWF